MYDFPDIQFRLSTAVKHEIESAADYSVSCKTFLCARKNLFQSYMNLWTHANTIFAVCRKNCDVQIWDGI